MASVLAREQPEVAPEQLPDRDVGGRVERQDELLAAAAAAAGRNGRERGLDPAAVAVAGDGEQVVDRGDAPFELEHAHVGVAHRLVAVDEVPNCRADVARLDAPRRLLARQLPVDDGKGQLVLRPEVPQDGLAARAGVTGDGVERDLVVRQLQPRVVGGLQDALAGLLDRFPASRHAVGRRRIHVTDSNTNYSA